MPILLDIPQGWQDAAGYVAFARDIVLLVLLAVVLVSAVVIARRVSAVVRSAQRMVNRAEDIVSTVSDKVVRPATVGSGVASGLGRVLPKVGGGSLKALSYGVAGLLLGSGVLALIRYLRGRSNGGRNNGE